MGGADRPRSVRWRSSLSRRLASRRSAAATGSTGDSIGPDLKPLACYGASRLAHGQPDAAPEMRRGSLDGGNDPHSQSRLELWNQPRRVGEQAGSTELGGYVGHRFGQLIPIRIGHPDALLRAPDRLLELELLGEGPEGLERSLLVVGENHLSRFRSFLAALTNAILAAMMLSEAFWAPS